MLDVTMSSPKESIPAYGASHSTGDVFRGRAQGNTFNIANAPEVWDNINMFADNPVEKQEKGKIHFYLSNLSPAEVDVSQSSFTTTIYDIKQCDTIQTFIVCGSRDYSPIRHK